MIKKLTAIITTASFVFSFIAGPAVAGVVEQKREAKEFRALLDDFVIPHTAGRITGGKWYGSRKVVVNIQDLHCHPEVQRNISRILGSLDERYRLKKVYVEGAAGAIDTSWLLDLKDKELKKEIVESLVEQGKLTGAEYYAAFSERSELLAGLEDETLYRSAFGQLSTILERAPRYEQVLQGMRADISTLKRDHFGPQSRKLDEVIEDHAAGRITTPKFYALLKKFREESLERTAAPAGSYYDTVFGYPAMNAYLETQERSRSLHYRAINAQMRDLMVLLKSCLPYEAYTRLAEKTGGFTDPDELYACLRPVCQGAGIDLARTSPQLNDFLTYVEMQASLNPATLIDEERRLIAEIRSVVAKSAAEEEIGSLSDYLRILDDAFHARLSAEDVPVFTEGLQKFRYALSKYAETDRLKDCEDDLALIGSYYRSNIERNDRFLRSSIGDAAPGTGTQATATARTLAEADEIVVMVTGGFHTQGLQQLLDARRISHVTVMPQVSTGTELAAQSYIERAHEQARIFASSLALYLLSKLDPSSKYAAYVGALLRARLEKKLTSLVTDPQNAAASFDQLCAAWNNADTPAHRATGDLSYTHDAENNTYTFTFTKTGTAAILGWTSEGAVALHEPRFGDIKSFPGRSEREDTQRVLLRRATLAGALAAEVAVFGTFLHVQAAASILSVGCGLIALFYTLEGVLATSIDRGWLDVRDIDTVLAGTPPPDTSMSQRALLSIGKALLHIPPIRKFVAVYIDHLAVTAEPVAGPVAESAADTIELISAEKFPPTVSLLTEAPSGMNSEEALQFLSRLYHELIFQKENFFPAGKMEIGILAKPLEEYADNDFDPRGITRNLIRFIYENDGLITRNNVEQFMSLMEDVLDLNERTELAVRSLRLDSTRVLTSLNHHTKTDGIRAVIKILSDALMQAVHRSIRERGRWPKADMIHLMSFADARFVRRNLESMYASITDHFARQESVGEIAIVISNGMRFLQPYTKQDVPLIKSYTENVLGGFLGFIVGTLAPEQHTIESMFEDFLKRSVGRVGKYMAEDLPAEIKWDKNLIIFDIDGIEKPYNITRIFEDVYGYPLRIELSNARSTELPCSYVCIEEILRIAVLDAIDRARQRGNREPVTMRIGLKRSAENDSFELKITDDAGPVTDEWMLHETYPESNRQNISRMKLYKMFRAARLMGGSMQCSNIDAAGTVVPATAEGFARAVGFKIKITLPGAMRKKETLFTRRPKGIEAVIEKPAVVKTTQLPSVARSYPRDVGVRRIWLEDKPMNVYVAGGNYVSSHRYGRDSQKYDFVTQIILDIKSETTPLKLQEKKAYIKQAIGSVPLKELLSHEEIDFIIAVPSIKRNRNHAELWADEVAARIKKGIKKVVRQAKPKEESQKKLQNYYLKQANVKDIFSGNGDEDVLREEIAGKTVLVVDDVVTSGSTMREVGRVIEHYGGTPVYLAIANGARAGDVDESAFYSLNDLIEHHWEQLKESRDNFLNRLRTESVQPVDSLPGIVVETTGGRLQFAGQKAPLSAQCDLILLRHGRTIGNAKPGAFLQGGDADEPVNQLDEEGRKQAQVASGELYKLLHSRIEKNEEIVIVTSPAQRAQDTIQPFVEMLRTRLHKSVTVVVDPAATEIKFGSWNNHTLDSLGHEEHEMVDDFWFGNNATVAPAGGETYIQLLKRARCFLASLNEKYKGKTVIVCSHGIFLGALRAMLMDKRLVDENGFIALRQKMIRNAEFRCFGKIGIEYTRMINRAKHQGSLLPWQAAAAALLCAGIGMNSILIHQQWMAVPAIIMAAVAAFVSVFAILRSLHLMPDTRAGPEPVIPAFGASVVADSSVTFVEVIANDDDTRSIAVNPVLYRLLSACPPAIQNILLYPTGIIGHEMYHMLWPHKNALLRESGAYFFAQILPMFVGAGVTGGVIAPLAGITGSVALIGVGLLGALVMVSTVGALLRNIALRRGLLAVHTETGKLNIPKAAQNALDETPLAGTLEQFYEDLGFSGSEASDAVLDAVRLNEKGWAFGDYAKLLERLGNQAGLRGPVMYYPFGGFDPYTPFSLSDDVRDVVAVGREAFGDPAELDRFFRNGAAYDPLCCRYDDFDHMSTFDDGIAGERLSGAAAVARIMYFLDGHITGLYYFDVNAEGGLSFSLQGKCAVIEFENSRGVKHRYWYMQDDILKANNAFARFLNADAFEFQSQLMKAAPVIWGGRTTLEEKKNIFERLLLPAGRKVARILTDQKERPDGGCYPIWKPGAAFREIILGNKENFGNSGPGRPVYAGTGMDLASSADHYREQDRHTVLVGDYDGEDMFAGQLSDEEEAAIERQIRAARRHSSSWGRTFARLMEAVKNASRYRFMHYKFIRYGKVDLLTGDVVIDLAAARRALKGVIPGADRYRIIGYMHAHELFHLLIDGQTKLSSYYEDLLADAFASCSIGVHVNTRNAPDAAHGDAAENLAQDRAFIDEFLKETKNEAMRTRITLMLSTRYDDPQYLLNLERLGFDPLKIRDEHLAQTRIERIIEKLSEWHDRFDQFLHFENLPYEFSVLMNEVRESRAAAGLPSLTSIDEKKIRQTALWVMRTHREDDRLDGRPYFVHQIGVTRALVRLFSSTDPLILRIALLHDSREDHREEYADMEREMGAMIRWMEIKGQSKAEAEMEFSLMRLGVRMLTKLKPEELFSAEELKSLTENQRKERIEEEYLRRLQNPRSVYNKSDKYPESDRYIPYSEDFIHNIHLIKLADRIFNLSDLGSITEEANRDFPSRTIKKTLQIFMPLFLERSTHLIRREKDIFYDAFKAILHRYMHDTSAPARFAHDAAHAQYENFLKGYIQYLTGHDLFKHFNLQLMHVGEWLTDDETGDIAAAYAGENKRMSPVPDAKPRVTFEMFSNQLSALSRLTGRHVGPNLEGAEVMVINSGTDVVEWLTKLCPQLKNLQVVDEHLTIEQAAFMAGMASAKGIEISFYRCSALQLPDVVVDVVFDAMTTAAAELDEHQLHQAASEIGRVLQPGGVYVSPYPDHMPFHLLDDVDGTNIYFGHSSAFPVWHKSGVNEESHIPPQRSTEQIDAIVRTMIDSGIPYQVCAGNARILWDMLKHPGHTPEEHQADACLLATAQPADVRALYDDAVNTGMKRHFSFSDDITPESLDHSIAALEKLAATNDASRETLLAEAELYRELKVRYFEGMNEDEHFRFLMYGGAQIVFCSGYDGASGRLSVPLVAVSIDDVGLVRQLLDDAGMNDSAVCSIAEMEKMVREYRVLSGEKGIASSFGIKPSLVVDALKATTDPIDFVLALFLQNPISTAVRRLQEHGLALDSKAAQEKYGTDIFSLLSDTIRSRMADRWKIDRDATRIQVDIVPLTSLKLTGPFSKGCIFGTMGEPVQNPDGSWSVVAGVSTFLLDYLYSWAMNNGPPVEGFNSAEEFIALFGQHEVDERYFITLVQRGQFELLKHLPDEFLRRLHDDPATAADVYHDYCDYLKRRYDSGHQVTLRQRDLIRQSKLSVAADFLRLPARLAAYVAGERPLPAVKKKEPIGWSADEMLAQLGIKDKQDKTKIFNHQIHAWVKDHELYLEQHPSTYYDAYKEKEFRRFVFMRHKYGTLKEVTAFILGYARKLGPEKLARTEEWIASLKRTARKRHTPAVEYLTHWMKTSSLRRPVSPLEWAASGVFLPQEHLRHVNKLFGAIDTVNMILDDLPIWPVVHRADGTVAIDETLIEWMAPPQDKTIQSREYDYAIPPAEYYVAEKMSLAQVRALEKPVPAAQETLFHDVQKSGTAAVPFFERMYATRDHASEAAQMIDALGIGPDDRVLQVGAGTIEYHAVACAVRGAPVDMCQPESHGLGFDQTGTLRLQIHSLARQAARRGADTGFAERIDLDSYRAEAQKAGLPEKKYSYLFLLNVLDEIDILNLPDVRGYKNEFFAAILASLQDRATLLLSNHTGHIKQQLDFITERCAAEGYSLELGREFAGQEQVYEIKLTRKKTGDAGGYTAIGAQHMARKHGDRSKEFRDYVLFAAPMLEILFPFIGSFFGWGGIVFATVGFALAHAIADIISAILVARAHNGTFTTIVKSAFGPAALGRYARHFAIHLSLGVLYYLPFSGNMTAISVFQAAGLLISGVGLLGKGIEWAAWLGRGRQGSKPVLSDSIVFASLGAVFAATSALAVVAPQVLTLVMHFAVNFCKWRGWLPAGVPYGAIGSENTDYLMVPPNLTPDVISLTTRSGKRFELRRNGRDYIIWVDGHPIDNSMVVFFETRDAVVLNNIRVATIGGDGSMIGQGIGSAIIDYLADYARAHNRALRINDTKNYGLMYQCWKNLSPWTAYYTDSIGYSFTGRDWLAAAPFVAVHVWVNGKYTAVAQYSVRQGESELLPVWGEVTPDTFANQLLVWREKDGRVTVTWKNPGQHTGEQLNSQVYLGVMIAQIEISPERLQAGLKPLTDDVVEQKAEMPANPAVPALAIRDGDSTDTISLRTDTGKDFQLRLSLETTMKVYEIWVGDGKGGYEKIPDSAVWIAENEKELIIFKVYVSEGLAAKEYSQGIGLAIMKHFAAEAVRRDKVLVGKLTRNYGVMRLFARYLSPMAQFVTSSGTYLFKDRDWLVAGGPVSIRVWVNNVEVRKTPMFYARTGSDELYSKEAERDPSSFSRELMVRHDDTGAVKVTWADPIRHVGDTLHYQVYLADTVQKILISPQDLRDHPGIERRSPTEDISEAADAVELAPENEPGPVVTHTPAGAQGIIYKLVTSLRPVRAIMMLIEKLRGHLPEPARGHSIEPGSVVVGDMDRDTCSLLVRNGLDAVSVRQGDPVENPFHTLSVPLPNGGMAAVTVALEEHRRSAKRTMTRWTYTCPILENTGGADAAFNAAAIMTAVIDFVITNPDARARSGAKTQPAVISLEDPATQKAMNMLMTDRDGAEGMMASRCRELFCKSIWLQHTRADASSAVHPGLMWTLAVDGWSEQSIKNINLSLRRRISAENDLPGRELYMRISVERGVATFDDLRRVAARASTEQLDSAVTIQFEDIFSSDGRFVNQQLMGASRSFTDETELKDVRSPQGKKLQRLMKKYESLLPAEMDRVLAARYIEGFEQFRALRDSVPEDKKVSCRYVFETRDDLKAFCEIALAAAQLFRIDEMQLDCTALAADAGLLAQIEELADRFEAGRPASTLAVKLSDQDQARELCGRCRVSRVIAWDCGPSTALPEPGDDSILEVNIPSDMPVSARGRVAEKIESLNVQKLSLRYGAQAADDKGEQIVSGAFRHFLQRIAGRPSDPYGINTVMLKRSDLPAHIGDTWNALCETHSFTAGPVAVHCSRLLAVPSLYRAVTPKTDLQNDVLLLKDMADIALATLDAVPVSEQVRAPVRELAEKCATGTLLPQDIQRAHRWLEKYMNSFARRMMIAQATLTLSGSAEINVFDNTGFNDEERAADLLFAVVSSAGETLQRADQQWVDYVAARTGMTVGVTVRHPLENEPGIVDELKNKLIALSLDTHDEVSVRQYVSLLNSYARALMKARQKLPAIRSEMRPLLERVMPAISNKRVNDQGTIAMLAALYFDIFANRTLIFELKKGMFNSINLIFGVKHIRSAA